MKLSVVVIVVCCLIACGQRTESEKPRALVSASKSGECIMMGNVPGHHYCETTYIQLLANPRRYEGTRVRFSAWAYPGRGEAVVLFPSSDAARLGDASGSIIARGAKVKAIHKFLHSRNTDEPVGIFVLGTFFVSENSQKGGARLRFGRLSDVESFDP